MGKGAIREQVIYHLERAARHVFKKSNKESFGVDRISLSQFQAEWKSRKAELQSQIREGSYKFSPYRPVVVPKNRTRPVSPENARPISIPTVQDRIVQRAILHATWTSLRDHIHTEWSFGGIREYYTRGKKVTRLERPSKSVRAAMARIIELQDTGNRFVFETDIRSFFQDIRREVLLDDIRTLLRDDSIDYLLTQVVSAEIDNNVRLGGYASMWDVSTGVPQGSVLSPTLANFYLYAFDKKISSEGFNLVRYVDDLVILGPDMATAGRAHDTVHALLTELGLQMHPLGAKDSKGRIKTQIRTPDQQFTFLGIEISRRKLRPSPEKWKQLGTRIEQATDIRYKSRRSLVDLVRETNDVVKGWIAAFSFCNLPMAELEERVDRPVRERMAGWMSEHELRRGRTPLSKEAAKWLGLRSASTCDIQPLRKEPVQPTA